MNEIPDMTDPLGKYWKQPDRREIALDDKHALMDDAIFARLADYSASMPSGVFPGKMWKAGMKDGSSCLRWYGIVDGKPELCSNNQREILRVES